MKKKPDKRYVERPQDTTSVWLRGVAEHIKIRQQRERLAREEQARMLEAPPEPGYGLDGYPLQRGKRWNPHG